MENLLLYHAQPLLAYIDAGTGSMIIQVIIGALAGGLLALKIFWNKLKNLFRKNNQQETVAERKEQAKDE